MVPTSRPLRIVKIPADLAEEIDRLAGRRGRAAYVRIALEHEIVRDRQLAALAATSGALRDSHGGISGKDFAEQIRSEPDEHFEGAVRRKH